MDIMKVRKAKIHDAIYDVITYEDFCRNRATYLQYAPTVAVEYGTFILPIRTPTDIRPGFYPAEVTGIDFFRFPTGRDCNIYGMTNLIDFSEAKNFKEVIEAQDRLNKAERSILVSVDNLTIPDVYDTDTPFMKAIKTAIIKKKIDMDKYAHRFGQNYPNDKRLLKKDDMTQQKGIAYADCLDFDIFMIIKDKDPNVPNPMGTPIVVKLTGEGAGFYDGYTEDQIENITVVGKNTPEAIQAAAMAQYQARLLYGGF